MEIQHLDVMFPVTAGAWRCSGVKILAKSNNSKA